MPFWLLFCCLSLFSVSLDAQEQPAPAPAGESTGTGTLTVLVDGVEGAPRDNVLAYLDINRFAGKSAPEETELRWLHANAERNIREALQPFGYYEPAIESSLNRTAGGWEARYRIQLGHPVHIAAVDVRVLGEAAQDPVFQKLLANLPLAKGQILDQPKYEQLKQNLETLATERGYFDARFAERTIEIDLQAYEAAIKLHYDTGKRYRFGDVTFKQSILSPKLLNRYPRFKPGDPYDANDLLKLQSDLGGSSYFSQIAVNASPDATTATAPVDVELTPNKKRKYSAGLGYGTDTGPRGKIKAEQRWINQQGHHYEAELQLSPIKSLLGFKYMIPGQDPITDEYAITAGYTMQNYDDQDYERIALGGSWQKQDGKWLKNYNLNLQYEDYQVGNEPRSTSLLLIPGLNWTWIDADDRLYATRGLLFGFELRGASTALLSDINFLQGILHLKWVRALNQDSRLIARGDLGATAIREDFEDLPASLRFYTGGDTSVRGYAYNKIGPTDDDGTVVGGKNLVVGSVEYEHRVWNDWSVAAFVDSGDAFDGASPEPKTGVGMGLRWRSPVGPVRIDFASGLDRPPGDAFRFSFSIGPDL
ncbi:MAG TPA: autotransporter assembly complex family protein [Candidatus Competibacter sp.]|nr:autotransporter assembly complex family protein [Candidatus Competibacter sp.]